MNVFLKYNQQYRDEPLLFSNSLWRPLTCTLVLMFKYMYTGPTALCDLQTMEQLKCLAQGHKKLTQICGTSRYCLYCPFHITYIMPVLVLSQGKCTARIICASRCCTKKSQGSHCYIITKLSEKTRASFQRFVWNLDIIALYYVFLKQRTLMNFSCTVPF